MADSAVNPAQEPDRGGLSHGEIAYYSRQLLLPELGVEGQKALKEAHVLVVGAGGLGSPVLMYLAAAGVGSIGVIDFDAVEISNPHRQVLFGVSDVGRSKARTAADKLSAANPFVTVDVFEERFAGDTAETIMAGYDLVIDAADNFAACYLINDVCVAAGKPFIAASILGFDGQVMTYRPDSGPCYRCLFPEAPPSDLAPSCAEAGVLGVLPGLIGTIQASEAIKLILGLGEPLAGRLLTVDVLSMGFQTLSVERDPACPACGSASSTVTAGALAQQGSDVSAEERAAVTEMAADALAHAMRGGEPVTLLDVRTEAERAIARIGDDLSIPVSELGDRIDEVPRDGRVVCYCHKGARSRRAAALLKRAGFDEVLSLEGGIDAWSRTVDPSVPRY